MDKGNSQTTQINQPRHSSKRSLLGRIANYSLLLFLFVLLAGHESINPKIGDSHVDFYLDQSKNLLEISAKASLLNEQEVSSLQQQVQLLTNTFYKKRNYTPAWTMNFTGNEQLDTLISLIDSSLCFGIPQQFINTFRITSLLDQLENHDFEENKIGQRISLEIEATQSALLLMTYFNRGIVQCDTSSSFYTYFNTLPGILNMAMNNGVQKAILSQQPDIEHYNSIIKSLPNYISLQNTIRNAKGTITKSDLNSALNMTGYMTGKFDSLQTISSVISDFQKKNNIQVSGIVNKTTIAMLGEVMDMHYQKIALNIDRLRKANVTSSEYLFVNIPEFKLYTYSQNKPEKEFVVVVGKRRTPTPTVNSSLNKIITNPYWTVPRSIARYELLPKIKADSTFMARNRYFIIDWKEDVVDASELDWESDDPFGKQYWLRQKYGGGNALGKVKFVFPNNFRVYLHDTPSKRFFKRDYRAYSHGCVRVQHPDELAQYLSDKYLSTLEDSVDIRKSIATRKRTEYAIEQKVDVHIQYITCKVNEEGSFIFFDDVYRKDKKELEQLFGEIEAI